MQKTSLALLGVALLGVILVLLTSCTVAAPISTASLLPVATLPPATATVSQPTVAPPAAATRPPQIVAAPSATTEKRHIDQFVKGQPGAYFPGKSSHVLEGFKRAGLKQKFTVWYPALKPAGFTGTIAVNGEPDGSAKPYPLILTSTIVGNVLAPHLASHGFVVAGVDMQSPSKQWGAWLIDYPREILAMLNQIAENPPVGLEGIIDSDNAGVMGYSFSGYDTLALAGARVDPLGYQEKCAQGPEKGSSPSETAIFEQTYRYFCEMSLGWDEFVANAGQALTTSQDDLWQPLTDPRIRAVMPMAPEGAWLFGKPGLAAIELPALMICGTQDSHETDYSKECANIFEQLGSPNKGLISFIDQPHMMIFDPGIQPRILHFITAFFGYHLQGRQEYAAYYSPEFVQQQPSLAWGVYRK